MGTQHAGFPPDCAARPHNSTRATGRASAFISRARVRRDSPGWTRLPPREAGHAHSVPPPNCRERRATAQHRAAARDSFVARSRPGTRRTTTNPRHWDLLAGTSLALLEGRPSATAAPSPLEEGRGWLPAGHRLKHLHDSQQTPAMGFLSHWDHPSCNSVTTNELLPWLQSGASEQDGRWARLPADPTKTWPATSLKPLMFKHMKKRNRFAESTCFSLKAK